MNKCKIFLERNCIFILYISSLFLLWCFGLLANLSYNRTYFEIEAKITGFDVSVIRNEHLEKSYYCRPHMIVDYEFKNRKYKNAFLLHKDILEYNDGYQYGTWNNETKKNCISKLCNKNSDKIRVGKN